MLKFCLNCYKEVTKNRIRPNFLKADYETIRARLDKINWTAKLNGKFLTAYKVFTESLSVAMKGCVPDFTSRMQRNNIYLTPVRKKDLKNKLWERYKRTRSQYDRRRFISIKNDLPTLTRMLQYQYEPNLANNVKDAPKRFWSYVKSKSKVRSRIPTLKKLDGSDASTLNDKAEALNEFFSSVFIDDSAEVSDFPKDSYLEFLDSFKITSEMVAEKLRGLSANKSPGPDGWYPIFLKNI